MASDYLATAEVSWVPLEEGGRTIPPTERIYAATAKFSEDSKQHFSIVLRHLDVKRSIMSQVVNTGSQCIRFGTRIYDIGFLSPETVIEYLSRDQAFFVQEGNRVVAFGRIISVDADLLKNLKSVAARE